MWGVRNSPLQKALKSLHKVSLYKVLFLLQTLAITCKRKHVCIFLKRDINEVFRPITLWVKKQLKTSLTEFLLEKKYSLKFYYHSKA